MRANEDEASTTACSSRAVIGSDSSPRSASTESTNGGRPFAVGQTLRCVYSNGSRAGLPRVVTIQGYDGAGKVKVREEDSDVGRGTSEYYIDRMSDVYLLGSDGVAVANRDQGAGPCVFDEDDNCSSDGRSTGL